MVGTHFITLLILATHGCNSQLTNALNILVAEDNDFNAKLLEQLLVRRGHRVRLASDGRVALSPGGGTPSTLLLDIPHARTGMGFRSFRQFESAKQSADEHLHLVPWPTAVAHKEGLRKPLLCRPVRQMISLPSRFRFRISGRRLTGSWVRGRRPAAQDRAC